LSKCAPLNQSLLPDSLPNPGFSNLLGPQVYRAVEKFDQLLSQEVYQSTIIANRQTDSARQSLSAVNLPQSLSAYSASDKGQGFPIDLWRKIETAQNVGTLELVKVKIWDLKDISNNSRDISNSVTNQLNNDLALHSNFKSSHSSYTGKDIEELQRPLRENLTHCKNLLDNALTGDRKLFSMQDKLEHDIKFQYLNLNKAELDKLIPSSDTSSPSYNTSYLTKLMVELTNLIKERESLLKKFNQDASSYNFKSKLIAEGKATKDLSTDECKDLIDGALATFEPIKSQIESNIDKQSSLLQKILEENTLFTNTLQLVSDDNDSSQNAIHMIEEALITLETIDKQLTEGQEFYNSILPLLRQLKEQSEELSSRLEIERLGFEQDEKRRLQEEDDWKVAQNLEESMKNARIEESSDSNYTNLHVIPPPAMQDRNDGNREPTLPSYEEATSTSANTQSTQNNQNVGSYVPPPLPPVRTSGNNTPGAHYVSNFENPPICVDDEKMARLLELGFDPDKVASALEKCNNNENDALNELLST